MTKNTETPNTAIARIVADCPKCNSLCEIDDLAKIRFETKQAEHCCMKCGESFYFAV